MRTIHVLAFGVPLMMLSQALPSVASEARNALTNNALTNNAITVNAITVNALSGSGLREPTNESGLSELNGVGVEGVVLAAQPR